MPLRKLRMKLRRKLRKQQRQAAADIEATEQKIDRYFFGRFDKFANVWRFMAAWLVMILLLIAAVFAQNVALSGYYQHLGPVPGGIYSEGIIGTFTNANPMYATSDVDQAVSRLIFAGLFTYDNHNKLVGDLASGYKVDSSGQLYTVTLRPGLVWQDGQPLTAADVVYTYQAIQNPDAESPLRSSWAGIAVAATDDHTVTFRLPNPLSSFPYSLTNGIVPKHLLGDVPMAGLRSASFNSSAPVGAGPFRWHDITIKGTGPSDLQEKIALQPFENYWQGKPKLINFTIDAFARQSDMLAAFKSNQLTAMSGLNRVPADIASAKGTKVYDFQITAATMVFFKTSGGVLADKTVRQALVQAANPGDIIDQLGYKATPVREPVLSEQFAYDPAYAQSTNQLAAANAKLQAAGWVVGPDGYRSKNGVPLGFALYAADSPEYTMVAAQLKDQWKKLGVKLDVAMQDSDTFHATLTSHSYDAVLYGVAIGADPDVFVYWHSSQADIRSGARLNLSEYKSPVVDTALEAGRTRTGHSLRKIKYQPFLKAWQEDAPALGLYQPHFIYVSHGTVYGLDEHPINFATDRFNNVDNWMIRTANVTNP